MIIILITFLLIALSSACNAIMDTLDHHHSVSIFKDFKKALWWNSDEGWRNKYIDRDPKNGRVKWFFGLNKPVQLTDAWHFFKMLMIIFICSAIVLAPLSIWITDNAKWYTYLILLIIDGTIWNLTFSLFYNKVLIK